MFFRRKSTRTCVFFIFITTIFFNKCFINQAYKLHFIIKFEIRKTSGLINWIKPNVMYSSIHKLMKVCGWCTIFLLEFFFFLSIHNFLQSIEKLFNWKVVVVLACLQSRTLGAHTYAHGFCMGMGKISLFMGGHGWA